jgi:L-fuculose-phosphate aldolase
VFLVNHGIVTTGPTHQVATVAAVLLERAAQQQWITHGFRSWPTWSDAPEALSKRDHIYHPQALDQVWNYLVRRLERLSHTHGSFWFLIRDLGSRDPRPYHDLERPS